MDIKDTLQHVLQRKGGSVVSVRPHDTVYLALEVMAQHNIGAVLVMDGNKPVGMLSERDYARKVVLAGRASRVTLVHEVMNHPLVTVPGQITVELAMALMSERHIRHLPVMDDEKIVGMVSIGDLVNWVISAQAQLIESLHEYIAGRYPG